VQGEAKDFQLQAFYDRTDRREPNFADYRNTVDVDFLDRFPLPRQEIEWGLGARASTGTNPTIVSGLYFTPKTRTDELFTGFVQDDVQIVPDRLDLTLGTKLLKTNYTGLEFEPTVRVLWTPTQNRRSGQRSPEPCGLRQMPKERFTFWDWLGLNQTAPHFREI